MVHRRGVIGNQEFVKATLVSETRSGVTKILCGSAGTGRTVSPAGGNIALYTAYDSAQVAQVLQLSRRGGKDLRSGAPIGAMLLKKTPSIVSLLSQGATALIACNDYAAMELVYWANGVGIEIPRHLSVVSFDNVGAIEPYGISSIDFGFAQLGYCAAHIFIGDVPVGVDSEGGLGSTCILNDRGSIGAPEDVAGIMAKMR